MEGLPQAGGTCLEPPWLPHLPLHLAVPGAWWGEPCPYILSATLPNGPGNKHPSWATGPPGQATGKRRQPHLTTAKSVFCLPTHHPASSQRIPQKLPFRRKSIHHSLHPHSLNMVCSPWLLAQGE